MLNRLQLLTTRQLFAVVTIVPSAAIFLFLVLVAPETYQSEAKIIVRESSDATAALIPGMTSSLLGLGTTNTHDDGYILLEYLRSAEFIRLAEKHLKLVSHFSSPTFAPFYRLNPHASRDDFLEYVRQKLDVHIDTTSGILSLRGRGFTPEGAHALVELMLQQSEVAINRLNERLVRAQTKLAHQSLEQSRAQLLEKRQALLDFQTTHSVVSPSSEIGTHMSSVAGLDARLVQLRAELRAKMQYLREDSFEVRSANQEIRALEDQRKQETETLVASGDRSMAAVLQSYEQVKMQADFALQTYASAFALVEKAKMEAARQEKFLLVVSAADIPDEPIGPHPFRGALTTFVAAALLFWLGRLIIATIRDHTI